jgi:hypothetical protein
MRQRPVFRILTLTACVAHYLLVNARRADAQNDTTFRPVIRRPAYVGSGPHVVIDEGHWNAFTTDEGRGVALIDLLRADGYRVTSFDRRFSTQDLRDANVLVIAAARGRDWQSLRSNGGTEPDSMISQPAYSPDETAAIVQWVRAGGALLLALEHYPYGRTMAGLAARLGVDVRDGYLADTAHLHRASLPDSVARGTPMESRIVASRRNRLLSDHLILMGRDSTERVSGVVIFGGTSFCGPGDAAPLIRVAPTAEQRIAPGDPGTAPRVGCAQGLAFSLGRGRVVVLGDANGFVTAQERMVGNKAVKVGLSMSDSDNRQLTLNVVHWLSGALK